jgi:hypothetical protein
MLLAMTPRKESSMSNNTNPTYEGMPEWYDPFVEPQTMPSGWDLTELHATGRGTVQREETKPAEPAEL